VLVSLALRAPAPRHAEMLVVGAALAILTIGLQAFVGGFVDDLNGAAEEPLLPGFWELVLLAAGCGLVAFGAVDRSPGPAWLGVANLAAFVAVAAPGDATLHWWPLFLLLIGGAAMAAGLRPRQPLPPEPDAYRAGDRPLASRTADDEVVVRVRDDSAP
jgi:peptidoglycan/LPS O-acetylase OafA/YrhL